MFVVTFRNLFSCILYITRFILEEKPRQVD